MNVRPKARVSQSNSPPRRADVTKGSVKTERFFISSAVVDYMSPKSRLHIKSRNILETISGGRRQTGDRCRFYFNKRCTVCRPRRGDNGDRAILSSFRSSSTKSSLIKAARGSWSTLFNGWYQGQSESSGDPFIYVNYCRNIKVCVCSPTSQLFYPPENLVSAVDSIIFLTSSSLVLVLLYVLFRALQSTRTPFPWLTYPQSCILLK